MWRLSERAMRETALETQMIEFHSRIRFNKQESKLSYLSSQLTENINFNNEDERHLLIEHSCFDDREFFLFSISTLANTQKTCVREAKSKEKENVKGCWGAHKRGISSTPWRWIWKWNLVKKPIYVLFHDASFIRHICTCSIKSEQKNIKYFSNHKFMLLCTLMLANVRCERRSGYL